MEGIILGTLRPALSRVFDTIALGTYGEVTDMLRDGGKYSYYIDGLVINIDSLSTVGESEVQIDFATLGDIREDLLSAYPYSLRGTRNNPKYVPLTKTSQTNEMPFLARDKQVFCRVTNTDDAAAITGVAIGVLAYPVLSS